MQNPTAYNAQCRASNKKSAANKVAGKYDPLNRHGSNRYYDIIRQDTETGIISTLWQFTNVKENINMMGS